MFYLARLRDWLRRPEVRRWFPRSKLIAAAVGAGVVFLAREVGVDLPEGWAESAGAALAGYLFPELSE